MASDKKKSNHSKYRPKGRSAKSYVGDESSPKKRQIKETVVQSANRFIRERAPESVSVDCEELPHCYYQTFVSIVPKDPFWFYAYWEVDETAESKAKEELGEDTHFTYTLRVYDVTHIDFDGTNANEWIDYDGLHANHRYVNVKHDDATYCVEIGVRADDGRFFAFARSNFITMPRQSLSRRDDLIWKEYDQEKPETLPFVNVLNIKSGIKQMRLYRGTYQYRPRRVSLSLSDVMNYYKRRLPLLELIKQRWSHLMDSHGQPLTQLTNVEFEKSSIPAIEEEMLTKTFPVGSSDQMQEQVVQQKRKFDFELKTELVITGRTDPKASVYWGGKEITLDHNGQFQICILLNEGAVPLDFKAIAPDKKSSKTITTQVTRTRTHEEYQDG